MSELRKWEEGDRQGEGNDLGGTRGVNQACFKEERKRRKKSARSCKGIH
jgi:hypothetical protein